MSNALARTQFDTTALILSSDFDDMKHKAQFLIRSGLLPYSIKQPEQCIVIALTAAELNIPILYGLRHITVINGNPSCDAQLMSALVERDYGPASMIVTEQTPEKATVRVMKPGWEEPQFVTYTMKEAVEGKVNQTWDKDKKEWVVKHPWKSHPTDMLRSRAVSRAGRTYFPASIGGLYTHEELGAEVEVDNEGRMTVVEVTPERTTGALPDAPMPDSVDMETGEIIDVSDTGAAPDSPDESDVWDIAGTVEAIKMCATPDGVVPIYLYAVEAIGGEDFGVIQAEVKGRLLQFLEHAESKADLEAVGKALKATELGSDFFRKEYKKAQERIMQPA